MVVNRFDIFFVNLDPTEGSEIQKIRPCVIISPDELNKHLSTIIIAPLTGTIKNYPFRLDVLVENKKGQIVCDQIRTIDKSRLKRKVAVLDEGSQLKLIQILQQMFMY